MRLAVDLSDFYDDHRSAAWIFVNEDMTKIRDLKKRIKRIFGISGFYLACDGRYLSPSEDIQIVSASDTIKITAKKGKLLSSTTSLPDSGVESMCGNKKKRRTQEETIENEWSPSKKKNNVFVEKPKAKSPKIQDNFVSVRKKTKKVSIDKDESAQLNAFNETLNNGEVDSTCNLPVKKIVDLYEKQGPLSSSKDYLKKITFDPEKITDKRINIIKTIIIRSPNIQSSHDNNIVEDCNNLVSSSLGTRTTNESNGTTLKVQDDTAPTVPVIEKRKRVRVRKRKRSLSKIKTPEIKIEATPRPFIAPEHSGSHIRFDNDVNDNPISNGICNGVTVNGNCETEIIEGENIEENKLMVEKSVVKPEVELKEEKVEEVSSVNPFTQECIMKCSLFPEFIPIEGEVIAFKVLRLSEDYTPEMSSYIVGSVHEYSEVSNEVTFQILSGFDQCSLPQGKFSVEEDNSEKKSNFLRTYLLNELVEIRLIYP